MLHFAAIGECMLEMRPLGDENYALGYAGDSFNTLYYLNAYRQEHPWQLSYLTALGDDPYSAKMLADWQTLGLDTQLVKTLPKRMVGMYFIHLDEQHERSFYYYRDHSPARDIFNDPYYQVLKQNPPQLDYCYFSGISIAILPEEGRQNFLDFIKQQKSNGCKIIYDNNYRPRLWQEHEDPQTTIQAFYQHLDLVLASFDDAAALHGETNMQQTCERYLDYGANEVIIKAADQSILLADRKTIETFEFNPVDSQHIIDTSAAGDSFNGGYLAARLRGFNMLESAHYGQLLASFIITEPGALIPQAKLPQLF